MEWKNISPNELQRCTSFASTAIAEPLEDPRRTRSGAQGFVECAIIYILSIYIGRLEYLVT